MSESSADGDLFECMACGNLGFGDGPITCCDRQMRRVGSDGAPVQEPTLEGLLRTVFGMSESELDVCLCVMEGGELTVRELADETQYDRSTVARHLGDLVELGVLEKRRKLLQQGGHVYVYSPNDAETVRRSFRGAFLEWVHLANSVIDDLSREKVEAIVETDSEDSQWGIYKE